MKPYSVANLMNYILQSKHLNALPTKFYDMAPWLQKQGRDEGVGSSVEGEGELYTLGM